MVVLKYTTIKIIIFLLYLFSMFYMIDLIQKVFSVFIVIYSTKLNLTILRQFPIVKFFTEKCFTVKLHIIVILETGTPFFNCINNHQLLFLAFIRSDKFVYSFT